MTTHITIWLHDVNPNSTFRGTKMARLLIWCGY